MSMECFEDAIEDLFDFQRFSGNVALQPIIDSVDARYGEGKLSLDQLGMLNAAGEPSVFLLNWEEDGFQ